MTFRREVWIAPLVLAALTIGVHWKSLLTHQYSPWDAPDQAYQVAPWVQVQASELHKGHWPLLWDPYIMGGHPLLAQGQPGAMFPLNWLLFAYPLHHGFVRERLLWWYLATIRFIAALAMYALCRDLQRSRIASIFSAAVFAFAGYIATTTWPQMLNGGVLAPLVLLFSLRAMRGEKPFFSAAMSGGILGLSWLSGHHQLPIFMTLAIAGIWIYQVARQDSRGARIRSAAMFAVLAAMLLMMSAVQTFPGYSYGQDSLRWVGASHELKWNEPVPYSVHDQYAQPPDAVLGTFIEGLFAHSNPFVGITAMLMAVIGVAMMWRNLAVRVLLGVASGGMLLAFSSATIFHGILYAIVPFVEKARDDAMAVFVFHVAICALAAFGIDAVMEAEFAISPWSKRARIGAAVIAGLMWLYVIAVYAAKMPSAIRPVNATLAAIAATSIVCILSAAISRKAAAILLTGVMLLEVGNLAERDLSNRDLGQKYWSTLWRDADIAAFLRSRPGPFRVEVNDTDVPYNFGDWYGIESYWGYLASAPVALMRVMADARALQLFGVRYYVAKASARGATEQIYESPATAIKVFAMPDPMPRAWVVHDVGRVAKGEEIGGALNTPTFDMTKSTFVLGETPPALESCAGDHAAVVEQEPEFVAIEATLACKGMVILGNAYAKDWTATVDGARVPVYAAYSLIDGVVANAGAHRIELRYRPISFYLGASLTGMAVILIVAMWMAHRRREE